MRTKLLFIIWSNSFGGGAERQLTNLVNNLDEDKYEIDLIEYFHTNINPEVLSPKINVLKPINNKITESKIKRFLINVLVHFFPWVVRKLYIKKTYDIEISFNYLIPTFLLAKDKKTKTISWIHGAIWDIEKNKNWVLNKLQRRSLNLVDKIVCIANDTKKSVISLYPEFKDKTTIIYNGYDFNAMKLLAEKQEITRNKDIFEILYCNRLDDNKNPIMLIEAAKILKKMTHKFHINLLGKGELESEVNSLIAKYKLENNVTIVGYKKNPYPYIKSSDIVVLTSKTEGFSNVIIEGLCFSKPFVSTNVGIVKEISKQNVGIVVKNSSDMANAFFEMINDKNKYNELVNNCEVVSNKFLLEKQINNFESVIDEVLNR